MANEYEVTNMSLFTAEIRDIVLDPDNDTAERNTRKVIKAKIVDNSDKSVRRVDITLAHQRRHKQNEDWQEVDTFALSQLRGGEEAKIHLNAKETFELFTSLQDLYSVSASDVPNGKAGFYVVYRSEAGNTIPEETIRQFVGFLNDGGKEVWERVTEAKLKIPVALAYHRIHELRQQTVTDFEKHMEEADWDEADWQKFFSLNDWIFGHGLAYQFLETLSDQPYYGGKNLMGRDGQRGDYLMATQANERFTVLVEIKRPSTLLLHPTMYRNKVYRLSEDLVGGVSQMLSNCRTWTLMGTREEDNDDLLEGVSTYQPKGILVIGNTAELAGNKQKQSTFELFRRNLQNPEILTFDELLVRAKFLVSHQPEVV